jgi:hypothetical protein
MQRTLPSNSRFRDFGFEISVRPIFDRYVDALTQEGNCLAPAPLIERVAKYEMRGLRPRLQG